MTPCHEYRQNWILQRMYKTQLHEEFSAYVTGAQEASAELRHSLFLVVHRSSETKNTQTRQMKNTKPPQTNTNKQTNHKYNKTQQKAYFVIVGNVLSEIASVLSTEEICIMSVLYKYKNICRVSWLMNVRTSQIHPLVVQCWGG